MVAGASEEICEDYLLGEMNLFLPTLKVRRNLDILCKLIQRNVLSRGMAERIVMQFNELLKAEGVEPVQAVLILGTAFHACLSVMIVPGMPPTKKS